MTVEKNNLRKDFRYNPKSLYTQNFLNMLKKGLGDPIAFKNFSQEQKEKIRESLIIVAEEEHAWNYNIKKGKCVHYDNLRYFKEFNAEYNMFCDIWSQEIENASPVGLTGKKRLVYKTVIDSFSQSILEIIFTSNKELYGPDENILHYICKEKANSIEWIKEFKKEINPTLFFNLIMLSIFEGLSSRVAIEKDFYLNADEFLKSYVIKDLSDNLIKALSLKFFEIIYPEIVPNYSKDEVDSETGLPIKIQLFIVNARIFLGFITKNKQSILPDINVIANTIFQALKNTKFISQSDRVVRGEHHGTMDVYRIENIVGEVSPVLKRHIPEILPPEKLTKKNIYTKPGVCKNMHNGDSRIVFSEAAIKSLNISQEKAYGVNRNYIKLLRDFDESTNRDVINKLPFPNKSMFLEKESTFKNYRKYVCYPIV